MSDTKKSSTAKKAESQETSDGQPILTFEEVDVLGGVGPSGLEGHTLTTVDDQLILFGGLGRGRSNEIYAFSTDTRRWYAIKAEGSLPAPRCYHTTNIIGSQLIVFGGEGQWKESTRECWNNIAFFDLETLRWNELQVLKDSPAPMLQRTTTLVKRRLYSFGGQSSSTPGAISADVFVFNIDEMEWEHPFIRGVVPPERYGHTATLIGTDIYIFGGVTDKGLDNGLYILDTESMEWKRPARVMGSPPPGRLNHVAVSSGNRLYILGGRNMSGNLFDDVYTFHTDSGRWAKLSVSNPTAVLRYGLAAAVVDGVIFLHGGLNGDGSYCTSTLYALDTQVIERSDSPFLLNIRPSSVTGWSPGMKKHSKGGPGEHRDRPWSSPLQRTVQLDDVSRRELLVTPDGEKNTWRDEVERVSWELAVYKRNSNKLRADLDWATQSRNIALSQLEKVKPELDRIKSELLSESASKKALEAALSEAKGQANQLSTKLHGAEKRCSELEQKSQLAETVYWELAKASTKGRSAEMLVESFMDHQATLDSIVTKLLQQENSNEHDRRKTIHKLKDGLEKYSQLIDPAKASEAAQVAQSLEQTMNQLDLRLTEKATVEKSIEQQVQLWRSEMKEWRSQVDSQVLRMQLSEDLKERTDQRLTHTDREQRRTISTLRALLKDSQQQLTAERKSRTEMENSIASLQAQLGEKEREIERLHDATLKANEATRKADAMYWQMTQAHSKVEGSAEQLAALQQQVDELGTWSEELIVEMAKNELERSKARTLLDRKVGAWLGKAKKLRGELGTRERAQADIDADIKAKISQMQTHCDDQIKELQEHEESQKHRLTAHYEELLRKKQEEIEAVRTKLIDAQQQLHDRTEDTEHQKLDRKNLENTAELLRQQAEASDKRREHAERERDVMWRSYERVAEMVISFHHDLTESINELTSTSTSRIAVALSTIGKKVDSWRQVAENMKSEVEHPGTGPLEISRLAAQPQQWKNAQGAKHNRRKPSEALIAAVPAVFNLGTAEVIRKRIEEEAIKGGRSILDDNPLLNRTLSRQGSMKSKATKMVTILQKQQHGARLHLLTPGTDDDTSSRPDSAQSNRSISRDSVKSNLYVSHDYHLKAIQGIRQRDRKAQDEKARQFQERKEELADLATSSQQRLQEERLARQQELEQQVEAAKSQMQDQRLLLPLQNPGYR